MALGTPRSLVSLAGMVALGLSGAGAQSPTAEDVARALEFHYKHARTLEADFVQRYTLGAQTLVESGHVYFQKPGRMRWDYDRPPGKFFLTDGRYAYLHLPVEKQIRRQPVKKAGHYQAAFALLLGKAELERLFGRLEVVRVHRLDTPARWQLRGDARSDKQPFTQVWLDLNDRFQLLRVEIRQRDGSLMEFHFRRWRENHALRAELFDPRVPPGTAWLEEVP
ncbi:MAG: outer membrane lipoprotein carrier protein LolA [Terriglobia bacterium]